MTILEPARSDQRRGVDEFAPYFTRFGLGWLANAFQAAIDGLPDALFGSQRVLDDRLFPGNLEFQVGDLLPDADLLVSIGARKISLGVRQTVLERLELTFG